MNPVRDSLAVVTGASAGIGRAFADHLARRGHSLLLISRDATRLAALADELARTYGVSARSLPADLSDEDEIERVARVLEAEPNVGVLINNAGFGTKGTLHETDADAQMRMLKLHMLAPMRHTRAVLAGMVARGAGWVINVSSIAAFMYGPENANYCATKAYLNRFSEGLDAELYTTGVVVQSLCPGFTHTEFHDRVGIDPRTIHPLLWMSADRVVDASIAAAERGGPVVFIPGLRNRILARFARMLPHWVMRRGRRAGT
jgi:hypothetical protein